MPAIWTPRRSSARVGIGGITWKKEYKSNDPEAHATEITVGPKGAGKSLLACHRAHNFHTGNIRNSRGFCLCDDPLCDATWEVFTNLESPTEEAYGAWAKPLNLASQMIDTESDDRHAIIWIDEAPQYFDARRGMLTEVIKMLKQVTMLRKKKIRLLLTAISFDWIDRRLRDQASTVYNCWTTNKGLTVNAIVQQLATGDIPPWKRNSIPPTMKYWNTRHARNWYNTDELVNADAMMSAARSELIVYVADPDTGTVVPLTMSQILGNTVGELVQNEVMDISPEELQDLIQRKYAIPVIKGQMKDWLIEIGFGMNKEGRFILRTEVNEGVLV